MMNHTIWPETAPGAALANARGNNISDLAEAARVRLAADPATPPISLRTLASDPVLTVRAAVAMNPAVADDVLELIAHDPDDRVRGLLAQRLALLLPSLTLHKQAPLHNQAMAALHTLVTDEATRVRAAIAEVVRDMENVPHGLIFRLASDLELCVSDPVIRMSPVLTAEDLLLLVSIPPGPTTATSVARRPHLGARIADVIASGQDDFAIAALLENRSAALSEATLDGLISRAAGQTVWHRSLARRHNLSEEAARALSEIVSSDILTDLARRADFSASTARHVAGRLAEVLAAQSAQPSAVLNRPPRQAEAMLMAQEMARTRSLNEETTVAAAKRGEVRLCVAMVAVAACVGHTVVERASTLRSAKGLVSIIWRAGFSMRSAGTLQTLLLRLPPEAVLHPTADGGFPLTPDEMRWQVDFLIRVGGPQAVPEAQSDPTLGISQIRAG